MESSSSIAREDSKGERLQALLLRLDINSDNAWREYDVIRRKLVRFFEYNHCWPAADYADQVLDRIAKRADLNEIRDIPSFAVGVARNVCIEYRKQMYRLESMEDSAKAGRPLVDPGDHEAALIQHMDDEVRLQCLKKCLAKLRADKRSMILDYYNDDEEKHHEHRRGMAERLGLNMDALRVRVNRAREKLEHGVEECLAARRRSLRSYSGNRGLRSL